MRLIPVELVRDCNVDEEVEDSDVRLLLLLLLLLLYLNWLPVSSVVDATLPANKTAIRHMRCELGALVLVGKSIKTVSSAPLAVRATDGWHTQSIPTVWVIDCTCLPVPHA